MSQTGCSRHFEGSLKRLRAPSATRTAFMNWSPPKRNTIESPATACPIPQLLASLAPVSGNSRRQRTPTLVDLLHSDTAYSPGSAVLEAGCGVGAQTVTLAARSRARDSRRLISRLARLRKPGGGPPPPGSPTWSFSAPTSLILPFAPESFDHVFVCFLLEHLARPIEALTALAAAAQAGWHRHGDRGRPRIDLLSSRQWRGSARDPVSGRFAARGRWECVDWPAALPADDRGGLDAVRVSPRMVYVDSSRPDLVDGFTWRTFTAMIEGVRDAGDCGRPRRRGVVRRRASGIYAEPPTTTACSATHSSRASG